MVAALHSLADRLSSIPDDYRPLKEGLRMAVAGAANDPEMSLTRARKVLEYVVRDVYQRRLSEPPGTRPLENLLQRLVKDGHFPLRLDAYANTVRKLGNVGTHAFGERVTADDVYQSLTQLLPIIEWYLDDVIGLDWQTDSAMPPRDAAAAGASSSSLAHDPPVPQPVVVPSPDTTAIIPKGLRSFDAADSGFFLRLLPGPFDAQGLPESIRFWKARIEGDEEPVITVGLLYGPSGCGKSSLVKAGLLPRLDQRVARVYVEATGEDTEARLLHALNRRFEALPADQGLTAALAAMRDGEHLAPGEKLLVVLDQFEQWLHAHRAEHEPLLVRALRQCDGRRVQCLVMVRDDFWMAATRFFQELGITLDGTNSAAADLFDTRHARHVLALLGAAYDCLPADAGPLTPEQNRFLDAAVADLAEDGRVICVRLALFAEMMKSKPWTPATLRDLGGAEGVGVAFLEDTFSSAHAPAEHRHRQQAARAVLAALLPEEGSDIKGRMRSHDDLYAASGAKHPTDFDRVLRILDQQLRLITPTEADDSFGPEPTATARENTPRYYQLAHDYLVPVLREWLTRKQRETRRGRAELRLAQRSSLWNARPEDRFLPSLLETVRITALVPRRQWSAPQQRMMRRATRVHGVRSALAVVLLVAVTATGLFTWHRVDQQRLAHYAEGRVHALLRADLAQVPAITAELADYRDWADPLLRQALANHPPHSREALHAALGLLPVDTAQADYLAERLLAAEPRDLLILREALSPHRAALAPRYGVVLADESESADRRFRAACALAAFVVPPSGGPEATTPGPPAEAGTTNNPPAKAGTPTWSAHAPFIAGYLVEALLANPSHYDPLWELLKPASDPLAPPLAGVMRDEQQSESARLIAAKLLTDHAAHRPELLADLLLDADARQFAILYPALAAHKDGAIQLLSDACALRLEDEISINDPARETLARRQANAAAALARLGQAERVWPLLVHSPDPRLRSWIVEQLAPLSVDPQVLVRRLAEEPDVSARRALLLALGQFDTTALPQNRRDALLPKLLELYRAEPDPGLRSAAGWLLTTWGRGDELPRIDDELAGKQPPAGQRWYVNGQGQTMVVIPGPVEFTLGSPADEPDREGGPEGMIENQVPRRIGRTFAIAAHEVTAEQVLKFSPDHGLNRQYLSPEGRFDPRCPANGVTWYQAAEYCNWLSRQEGIPEDQWCYLPNAEGKYAEEMRAADDYLARSGYRLPTEAEWEYACRAGAHTSRPFGPSEDLLAPYAWYTRNSLDRWMLPVGSLKPNELGLHDMLGNAMEWCHEYFANDYQPGDDFVDTDVVEDKWVRVLRGGSFGHQAQLVRCAVRDRSRRRSSTATLGSARRGLTPERLYPFTLNPAWTWC